jgi:hypothetical protein
MKYDTMSNMKDYMMWLDENGIATWDTTIGELIVPDSVDIYDAETVERYKNDGKWHLPTQDDDEDMIEDEDDNGILDDDELGDNNKLLVDCSWTPEEHWITPNGGITADASTYLHELDSKGELI